MIRDQLPVIFVGCEHKNLKTGPFGFFGQCTYHIVGLIARHLQHGDIVSPHNVFDDGHRFSDILGRGFTLSFVTLVFIMTEGFSGRIESYGNMRRFFLPQYIFERIDKSKNSRSIQPLGIDTRISDKGVVCTVNNSVGIEQKESFHLIKFEKVNGKNLT